MKLEKLNNNEFILNYYLNGKEDFKYINTLEKLFVWADFLEIKLFGKESLEQALIVMEREGHNYAEFGTLNRSFIFSEKRNV